MLRPPIKSTVLSQHARSQQECKDGSAEHDGRAVAQWDVFDRVEHAEEEDAAEHSLHDGANSNPGWAEDSVSDAVTVTLAFEHTEGKQENELKGQRSCLYICLFA